MATYLDMAEHMLLAPERSHRLTLAGTDDRPISLAHAEVLVKTIPGPKLRYIPDAGQLPYLEEPKLFEQEALDFLTQSDAAES